MDNTISASLSDEGGYAYARIGEDGKSIGINYNDPCGYRRLNVWDGATVRWGGGGHESSLTASWQLLADDMALDNDFTALSLFSMHQKQLENAFTLEYQFRRAQPTERWNYLFGAFAFGRILNLTAPVLFQRDGIEQLILAGANRGIQTVFPDAEMMIDEDSFPISSDFFLPSAGLALFHHSTFRFGRWRLDAGLRADFDYSAMSYDSEALIHYSLKTIQDDFLPLRTVFEGFESKPSFQVLPSLSLTYQLDFGHFQACISRGHKAGGFNTQIFSDILQNRMMSDMVEGLGFHLKDQGGDSGSAATSYLPEYHRNFELGGVWTPSSAASLSLTAFCILSRNLQVTVMPPGLGTGRLMSNAARARSLGLDAKVGLTIGHLDISIWGSNLLNTGYGTFRFRSVGRDFIAVGRPICAGLSIKYSML
ncbi:MAG: TonB-dependent receptor [Bacteroidales bacterium]|nr:TonB-dependent receptor [Bacteroidales bacterium]MBR0030288.1 TonB-dependent receptor [Bacteroidales bacterium]